MSYAIKTAFKLMKAEPMKYSAPIVPLFNNKAEKNPAPQLIAL
jgi:hypothetical protein